MDWRRKEEALLALIEEFRAARLEALEEEACGRERAILGEAHRAARERIREVFAEERARLEEHASLAEARVAGHRRQRVQQRSAALLELGWRKLPEVLQARWRDPGQRAQWVRHVLAQAREALPSGRWRIELAAGLSDSERAALADAAAAIGGEGPDVIEDATIAAGLRVASRGNVVDATIDGLLDDREAIGARLLHVLQESER